MLQIIHHTPKKLILQDQRWRLRIFAVGFTVTSLMSMALIVVNSYQRMVIDGGIDWQRLPAQIVFFVIGIFFVGLSLFTLFNFSRGLTITFDREAETVNVQSARFFRQHIETFPIYGVSHVRVERNDELRAFGLFLVLRAAGTRYNGQIPLTVIPYHEQDHMENLVHQVQHFLKR